MTAKLLLGDPMEEALGDTAGELPQPLSVLAVKGSADDLAVRAISATTAAELRRRVMIADSCSSNEHGKALVSSQTLCCVI